MARAPRQATPALTEVAAAKLWHRIHIYDHHPQTQHFGHEAAQALGLDPQRIYKTLIVASSDGTVANAVVAVADMLNLKRVAHALGVKSLDMADATMAQRKTGYVLGGISPLGQKHRLAVVIDTSVYDHETVFVSGGQRGMSLELRVDDLLQLTGAIVASIRREDA